MTVHKNYFNVTQSQIDASQFVTSLGDPGHGAQVYFFGVVRSRNNGKDVVGVSYDAYGPLASSTFSGIASDALARFGDPSARISIIHRSGRLKVGEVSVAIGVSTAHRDEAYRINRFIIEEIKKRAPVWKKEHYADGESEWVKGHALCSHASGEEGHDENHRSRSCGG